MNRMATEVRRGELRTHSQGAEEVGEGRNGNPSVG